MHDLDAIGVFLEQYHLAFAAGARAVVEREIAPLPPCEEDGAARRQALEILRRLGASNLLRAAIPQEYGGLPGGPDLRACCLAREALAAVSPLADAVFALQALGSMPIALAGSDEQKRRWLPAVAAGRAMAAFAMSEPEAGSDVAGIRTTARRDGEAYVLDGGKWLISNAGLADFYCVFAATDRAAGNRGLSCFLVPADAPGLAFVGPQVLATPHPLGELAFTACRVPATARLGAEGEGFALGMRTLDRLRASVAAAACGMAARALALALDHARQRRQFGKPLAEHQLVQEKLARGAIELTAARLLTYRAAYDQDRGAARVTRQSAMAKAHATEMAQRVVDEAIQIVGGRAVLAGHPLDQLYRAVRALRIYEGTTEIQYLVIARAMLRDR